MYPLSYILIPPGLHFLRLFPQFVLGVQVLKRLCLRFCLGCSVAVFSVRFFMRMYDSCGVTSLAPFFSRFYVEGGACAGEGKGEGFAFRSVGWAKMEMEMETVERREERCDDRN